MAKKKILKVTNEELARMIATGFATMATKDDLKDFSTKKDLLDTETRILDRMATKDHIKDLESKLIEDTGYVGGVHDKHNRALAQRVSKLEKQVFKTS